MTVGKRCMERSRSLTIYLSLLALALNLLCAITLQLLPANTTPLAFNFSLYSICGAVISLLGLFGAIKRYPSLLTIFSNHLLLDALISTLPRLLLLPVFSSLPTTFCSFFDPRHPILQAYADEPSATVASGNSDQQQQKFASDSWVLQRCRALTWLALIITGIVLVCLTIMQWICAWRVHEYAQYLENLEQSNGCSGKQKVESETSDMEKGWRSNRSV